MSTSSVRSAEDILKSNLLVKHLAGSHAYGTNIESSDVDIRGIFIADPVNIRTPFFPIYEFVDKNSQDTKYYELSDYLKLYLQGNPNILESLWVDESDVLFRTPEYELLRVYRKELLSAKIAFTFTGYASSQLKRIKGHNKWINNPQPRRRPQQIDFVSIIREYLPNTGYKYLADFKSVDTKFVRLHQHTLLFGIQDKCKCITENGELIINDDIEEKFFTPLSIVGYNHDAYVDAVNKWENYWTWKNSRNEKRAELEYLHGYDTKHAMHLVRLMRMGVEILTTGEVLVKRPDFKELLEIRNGSWSYDEVIEYAEHMDHLVRDNLYNRTELPKKPNVKLASFLLLKIQDMTWSNPERNIL